MEQSFLDPFPPSLPNVVRSVSELEALVGPMKVPSPSAYCIDSGFEYKSFILKYFKRLRFLFENGIVMCFPDSLYEFRTSFLSQAYEHFVIIMLYARLMKLPVSPVLFRMHIPVMSLNDLDVVKHYKLWLENVIKPESIISSQEEV